MKNLSKLGKTLSKSEQKEISGGFWGGCQAQLLECESDRDCPFCSAGCGIVVNLPDGPKLVNVCAF